MAIKPEDVRQQIQGIFAKSGLRVVEPRLDPLPVVSSGMSTLDDLTGVHGFPKARLQLLVFDDGPAWEVFCPKLQRSFEGANAACTILSNPDRTTLGRSILEELNVLLVSEWNPSNMSTAIVP